MQIPVQKIDGDTVDEIEKLLNNRPRKVLKFRTPIEIFNQHRIKPDFVALRN
jgi:IS30 family transposase